MSADVVVVVAGLLALTCLALWLLELTPPFVPTLLLAGGAPLLLASRGLGIAEVLQAAVHPVMALFFGGFVLAAGARRHGLDRRLVALVVRGTGGQRRRLVVGLAVAAAFLSMWMSNIAAAALLVQVVRPLIDTEPAGSPFRRATLLAVAFGANLGGLATPIGSGPNAIAIAAVAEPISFARWMSFALPLVAVLLVVVVVVIVVGFGVSGRFTADPTPTRLDRSGVAVVVVFALCIAGWLTAPLHGVDAAVVAVIAAAVLFGSRLLGKDELRDLDWSTLLLISGGLVLGEVLQTIGVLERFADVAAAVPAGALVLVIVAGAAVLSALMSNTATATLLVPLGMSVDPTASMAVLVAVGCSLGAPFVISTPPNAMVVGAGVTGRDLLVVGLPILVVGVVLVAATGPWVLAWFGLG